MSQIKYVTRGNSSPNGKPRVYFTCHPNDFESRFQMICEDIFATQDCAIYYTEDMSEPLSFDDIDVELGRFNLFVVPITLKLLNEESRAMSVDIAYAKANHIPILPIMLERGIDIPYSRPEAFGELQYLNRYSDDPTEISYEEKLKKYLSAILISNDTAKKIRAAFEAYIFLSYRKKDRKYANELMRLIHKNEKYRDIAIWYDEFLTPGESFNENIERIMRESALFALLVTPNLLEASNYVMNAEYPIALGANMPILPAEMVKTDKDALKESYLNIPECIDPEDSDLLDRRLQQLLEGFIGAQNNSSPEHKYLIGLAYLDGIDVEINRERGLALIEEAAEEGCISAIDTLYGFYSNGTYVPINYGKALELAKKALEYYTEVEGESGLGALASRIKIVDMQLKLKNFKSALPICERGLDISKEITDKNASNLMTKYFANQLSTVLCALGDYERAIELQEDVVRFYITVFGSEEPDTLTMLNNLAMIYRDVGDVERAGQIFEELYKDLSKLLGEEHPDTLICLGNIASLKIQLEKYDEALEIIEPLYDVRCRVFGKTHPHTLDSLHELAMAYSNVGDFERAGELYSEVIALTEEVLGIAHPDILTSLENYLGVCVELGDNEKIIETLKKIYACRCSIYGKDSVETAGVAQALGVTLGKQGAYLEGIQWFDTVYSVTHNDPENAEHAKNAIERIKFYIHRINDTSLDAFKNGNFSEALDIQKTVYELRCKYLGEDSEDALISLNDMAVMSHKLGDAAQSLEIFEKLYAAQCRTLGDTDNTALSTLNNIVSLCFSFENYGKAAVYLAKMHDVQCRTVGEISMPAFETIDLLCKTCMMAIEQNDLVVFTNELIGSYNCKVLNIFKDIVGMYISAEEYSTARVIYDIIYRYYSETEGADSKNALEIKAILDDIANK